MSTVLEIRAAIEQLSPQQYAEFREWFEEYESSRWDQQIVDDVAAGKLDHLADEAILEVQKRTPRR